MHIFITVTNSLFQIHIHSSFNPSQHKRKQRLDMKSIFLFQSNRKRNKTIYLKDRWMTIIKLLIYEYLTRTVIGWFWPAAQLHYLVSFKTEKREKKLRKIRQMNVRFTINEFWVFRKIKWTIYIKMVMIPLKHIYFRTWAYTQNFKLR